MSLIITFMFEPAKLQMNWASASGTRIRRVAFSGMPHLLPIAVAGFHNAHSAGPAGHASSAAHDAFPALRAGG
jgi:hypothetical protein